MEQQFVVNVGDILAICNKRTEHEVMMDSLVVVSGVIAMEAEMEGAGLIPVTKSWN